MLSFVKRFLLTVGRIRALMHSILQVPAVECARCLHGSMITPQLHGVGIELGANLEALKDRSPAALLTAILDPNRAVEAKYQNYVALTDDGLAHSGMVVSQTASSVTLAQLDGKQTALLRSDLEELNNTGHSFMPEGLEKDLSQKDLADLFEFLGSSSAQE